MGFPFPGNSTFAITPPSQTQGTPVTGLIPPYPGVRGSPLIYGVSNREPNWNLSLYSVITKLLYTTGATAHNLFLMRPLNWTTVAAAAAASQAVINLTNDPGAYTTNYRYPVPGTVISSSGFYAYPGRVANNGISANDYAAYQLTDGTWMLDKVASVSSLAITMTTNVPTGGVAAGAPFFFYGIKTDSDPATGAAHATFLTIASTNKINQFGDHDANGFAALHPGDPLMVMSDNATNAGVMDLVTGDYRKF